MKKNYLSLSRYLFALLLFVTFFSCRKNEGDMDSASVKDSTKGLSLKTAIEHYKELVAEQGDVVKTEGIRTMSSKAKPNKKYVMFKKAYRSETDKALFVEVPIVYNKRTTFTVTKGARNANLETPTQLLSGSFDRLIIYQDKKTGKMGQRIVTYMPDKAYLTKHNNDASNNKINRIDKDFNGYITYRTWDEKLLYILKIKNGKSVKRFTPKNKPKNRKVQSSDIKTTGIGCIDWYYQHYEEMCVTDDPEDPSIEICGYVLVWEEYLYTTCDDDESNDPCDDPANFEDCGGGGGDCGYTTYSNGIKVMNDCGGEGQDPDLNSDCYSWSFKNVGPNGYQACGVNKIDVDRYDAYIDPNGQAVLVTESFTMPTVYFEMPGRFTSGEAASLCAQFTDAAEEAYEDYYRNQPPLQSAAAYLGYLNLLKPLVEAVGGRVSLQTSYSNLTIRDLSKVAYGNGNCN